MNDQVQALAEQLSRAAMRVDAADLPSLADVHTHLDHLRKALAALDDGSSPPSADERIGSAMDILEKIILRDMQDVPLGIQQLHRTISEIDSLISGESSDEDLAEEQLATTAPPVISTTTAPLENAAAPPAEQVAQQLNAEDLPLLTEFIAEAGGHIESAEAELLKLDATPEDADAINAVFRGFHTIKGVAGFLNLVQIGQLAHAAENLLDLARKGERRIEGGTLDVILDSVDLMKRMLAALDNAVRSQQPVPPEPAVATLVERLRQAAQGGQSSKETAAKETAKDHDAAPAATAAPAAAPAASASPAATAASPASAGPVAPANVKVATDRLDKLINAVGELVIAHAMANQDIRRIATGDQRFLRNMTHLGKITRELQDLSMSMRMVPIQGVFQKMTRLVRDLARKAGKEIELHVEGGETELDRNVVDAISDPLVHMVRNAADHGIESAEVRARAGKPRAGQILLKARHQAGNVVIQIVDDGKGLDTERILQKARAAGIVRNDETLSQPDIFRLIFHPGLSTAEKVTDVSGRGVGMDVVRKNVEALRGRIDIESAPGKGSTFTIRLPLTLAVIDGLIVKVGRERFIIPIMSIEQSLRPKPEQLSTIQGRGEMCMVRDCLLPVVRLHRLFNITPTTEIVSDAIVVIVQDNHRRCCLLVDELLGQQQVVIKGLGEMMGSVPGTSGAAIMGDGCVSLILDITGVIDLTVPAN